MTILDKKAGLTRRDFNLGLLATLGFATLSPLEIFAQDKNTLSVEGFNSDGKSIGRVTFNNVNSRNTLVAYLGQFSNGKQYSIADSFHRWLNIIKNINRDEYKKIRKATEKEGYTSLELFKKYDGRWDSEGLMLYLSHIREKAEDKYVVLPVDLREGRYEITRDMTKGIVESSYVFELS